MEEKTVLVKIEALEDFAAAVFKGIGVPEQEAGICADVLIAADKRGIDTHGIGRLKQIYYDRIKAGTQSAVTNFEIVREGPTTAVVDGHNGMGQVIAKRSMQIAVDKAKKFGTGMVAVRNSTHYGIAGYYCMMAAENGLIGISGTNARPSVAPTFGVENMLGTNPLAFGFPTDEDFPFVIDCATSLSQRGKVELYDRLGKELPPGWVIGEDGKTRTDTHKILEDLNKGSAAFTPLGGPGEEGAGYKGYGYCTVVEVLSAALQQGSFMKMLLGVRDGKKVPINLGHFFMAVDISAFCPVEEFKKMAGDMLRALRASKKEPGRERIYTAGEKEYLAWLARKDKGVPVTFETQKEIKIMTNELGLKGHSFPF